MCAAHAREREQYRGSAASRGYDRAWFAFRDRFKAMLIAVGIVPACGASLPGGPAMQASECRRRGHLNIDKLHLHHDPPLRPEERSIRRLVCDPLRVGFLCVGCHSAETLKEQRAV